MNKIIYHALCATLMLVRLLGVTLITWGFLISGLEEDGSSYRVWACTWAMVGVIISFSAWLALDHFKGKRYQQDQQA